MSRNSYAAAMRVFWKLWREGTPTEDAAVAAGVGVTTGRRHVVAAGGVAPREVALSGRFLSFEEREEIALLRAASFGVREIARRVGRSPSTISRELRRSRPPNRMPCRASRAQLYADRRARRPKPAKLAVNAELRGVVQGWLNKKWSPEQISRALRRDFPNRPEMWVSHETIYQALYVQSRGAPPGADRVPANWAGGPPSQTPRR